MVFHERPKECGIFACRLQGVDTVVEVVNATRCGLEGLGDPIVSVKQSVSCLDPGHKFVSYDGKLSMPSM